MDDDEDDDDDDHNDHDHDDDNDNDDGTHHNIQCLHRIEKKSKDCAGIDNVTSISFRMYTARK